MAVQSFNRINPNRSIPTYVRNNNYEWSNLCFNRINPNRSIPTSAVVHSVLTVYGEVSIVSIQTDQSRQRYRDGSKGLFTRFQSYQSKQINPDEMMWVLNGLKRLSFQSYQSKQINPDFIEAQTVTANPFKSFNRINPNRSIPTSNIMDLDTLIKKFQSYQSKQINPD